MIRSLLSPARGWMITLLSCLLLAAPAGADVVDIEDDYLIHGNSTAYVTVCEHTFAGGEFPNAAQAGVKTLLYFANASGGARTYTIKITVQPNGGGETTIYEDYGATYANNSYLSTILDVWFTTNLGPTGNRLALFSGTMTRAVRNNDADGDTSLRTTPILSLISDLSIAAWDFASPWTMRVYVKHSVAHQSLTVSRYNCGWHVE
jgi:hypothetical protein